MTGLLAVAVLEEAAGGPWGKPGGKSWAHSLHLCASALCFFGCNLTFEFVEKRGPCTLQMGWKGVRSGPKPLWIGCVKAFGECKMQTWTVSL